MLAARAGVAPDLLLRTRPGVSERRAQAIGAAAERRRQRSFVEGAYACYSYSFSPYFPGWLIRSSMLIGPGHGLSSVAYSHNMPP